MRKSVSQNSIDTFYRKSLDGSLDSARAKVFKCINSSEGISTKGISRVTGIPLLTVRPRCTELLYDYKLITIISTHDNESYFRALDSDEKPEIRKLTDAEEDLLKLKDQYDVLHSKYLNLFTIKSEYDKLELRFKNSELRNLALQERINYLENQTIEKAKQLKLSI